MKPKDHKIVFHIPLDWWEEKNSGVQFPCQCCGEAMTVQIKLAKYAPKNVLHIPKPQPIC